MFAEERQAKIYEILMRQHSVKVADLSRLLDISEVTIRRDLDELQLQNKVLRTHGGAVMPYSLGWEVSSNQLQTKNQDLKHSIAVAAYEKISEHDTVLLDNSSTVYELALLIAEGQKNHLRVITTSLQVVQALSKSKSCNVMIVGGDVNQTYNTVEGYLAIQFIKNVRVDKCFIGINGIDESFGLSTPRYKDAEIKSQMIASSVKSFVLADHTKFDKVYLARVDMSSCLITDSRLPNYSYDKLGEDMEIIFTDADPQNEGSTPPGPFFRR